MSKEKQIEEMAKDLAKHSFFYNGGCLMNYSNTAKLLYNAGYRKQSEGEWVKSGMFADRFKCSLCNMDADSFIGGYDWDIYFAPPYCPNCGAKMKGESK